MFSPAQCLTLPDPARPFPSLDVVVIEQPAPFRAREDLDSGNGAGTDIRYHLARSIPFVEAQRQHVDKSTASERGTTVLGMSKLLATRAVAQRLGVSERRVRQLPIESVPIEGDPRMRVYRSDEVDRIAGQRVSRRERNPR